MRKTLISCAAVATAAVIAGSVVAFTAPSAEPASAQSVTPPNSSVELTAETVSTVAAAAPVQLPLSDYVETIYGENLTSEERAAVEAEQARLERELQACLNGLGFEYFPGVIDYSGADAAYADSVRPDDADWVARYGYGVIDFPAADPADVPANPNQDYVLSLPASEQERYWDNECFSITGPGTYPGADSPLYAPEFTELHDAISAFFEQLPVSAALAGVQAAWSSCMADAGYPGLGQQADAQGTIDAAVSDYWAEGADPAVDPSAGTIADPALAAIAVQEVAIASADLDCRTSTDFTESYRTAQAAAETEFVNVNRAGLDALVAIAIA